MAITSTVARHYSLRLNAIGIVSIVFFIWGAYDLWVKIPRENALAEAFEQVDAERAELEAKGVLTAEEQARAQFLDSEITRLSEGGTSPARASEFDHVVCWIFMACLPVAPYFFWKVRQAKRRVYTLEDDGTLIMPEGTWPKGQIADIDMSKWMAKSIAWVVHRDGKRVKLDDHIHRNLHLMIGQIASERYPDEWDAEAKPVTKAAADPDGAGDSPDLVKSEGPDAVS